MLPLLQEYLSNPTTVMSASELMLSQRSASVVLYFNHRSEKNTAPLMFSRDMSVTFKKVSMAVTFRRSTEANCTLAGKRYQYSGLSRLPVRKYLRMALDYPTMQLQLQSWKCTCYFLRKAALRQLCYVTPIGG